MECSMENKEFHLMKIKFMKKFFLKSFLVGLLVLILGYVFASLLFHSYAVMLASMYGLSKTDYAFIFVLLFGIWKILIIQFALVPYIVMVLIEKHIKEYHMHKPEQTPEG